MALFLLCHEIYVSIISGLQEENILQDVRISQLETLVNNGSSVGGNVTGITYFMEGSK